MMIDDEVAARRRLVVARVRLRHRRLGEERETMRDEPPRSLDPLLIRPPIARVGVLLLGRDVLLIEFAAAAATAAAASRARAARLLRALLSSLIRIREV